MEKVKEIISRIAAWLTDYWHFIVQMFHDAQPTEAEREANRQRREQEKKQAEVQRQQQAQAAARQIAYQNFQNFVAPMLRGELFQVCFHAHSRMGIRQPSTLANLPFEVTMLNGLLFAKIWVTRLDFTPMAESTLVMLRDLVQSIINDNLLAGMVENCPYAWKFPGVPFIVVDNVRVDGGRLVFTLGITDTEAAARRWKMQQAAQPMPTAPAEPYDDVL